MDTPILDALAARHPAIFKGAAPDTVDLPEGWIALVGQACQELAYNLSQLELNNLYLVEICERYGVLELRAVGVWSDTIKRIFRRARETSATTWQECGDPGRLRRIERQSLWRYATFVKQSG